MWHMTMFCEQNGMCVADEEFDLNDMTTGAALSDRLYAVANPLNFADMGTLTFTDVTPPIATPEPSSIVLLCAGVGVALALRKLIS